MEHIAHIALVVNDYDEAIDFYTQKLGFNVIEDTVLSEAKRWVLVQPNGNVNNCKLLLAKAANAAQQSVTGNQTGGRVFLFLYTDDFDNYYKKLVNNGVKIIREVVEEAWGRVAVFADLYGNLWDLIEQKA